MDWVVCVEEDASPARIEPLWRDLQSRSAHSFFQSWAWIGAWLKTIPDTVQLVSLEVRADGRLVGLSVLGRNTITHSRVFASRALLVSEAGDPNHDALTVEHSGLLMERGLESDVVHRSLLHLNEADWQWDELHVSGVEISQALVYIDASVRAGLKPVVRAEHPYFFVDLAELRDTQVSYLSTLSANTRHQVRRSMRLYEGRDGVLQATFASTSDEAVEYFEVLKEVHQQCWIERGKPGAFANQRLTDFHRTLIEECFGNGEVQLVRVHAGDLDFGYLYNFVMDGVVSNYQTGFRYDADSRFKPGLVSHALAVEKNIEMGNSVYDFLMGEQRFKRSLARHEAMMQWLILRRGGLPRSIGSGIRGLSRLLSGN
jgi:CelD/BcsL family acetyltransferase involved in cellulose biosynthesis